MARLSPRQAEAITAASLQTGILPSWVHGHTLAALRRKGLVTMAGSLGARAANMLTLEGRKLQDELIPARTD